MPIHGIFTSAKWANFRAENLAHYYDQLMYGYQAYVAVLKAHTLGLEQSSTAFQAHVKNVVNVFDDYRILTAIRHGHLGLTTTECAD